MVWTRRAVDKGQRNYRKDLVRHELQPRHDDPRNGAETQALNYSRKHWAELAFVDFDLGGFLEGLA